MKEYFDRDDSVKRQVLLPFELHSVAEWKLGQTLVASSKSQERGQ